jgi:hypothetical protein
MHAFGHVVEPFQRFLDKGLVHELKQFGFAGQVVFIDLEGLLEQAVFKFDKVSVIPCKDGDLARRMRYFAYYTHTVNECGKGTIVRLFFIFCLKLTFNTIKFEFQIPVHLTLVELVQFHLSDKSLKFEFSFLKGGFERLRFRFHVR